MWTVLIGISQIKQTQYYQKFVIEKQRLQYMQEYNIAV